MVRDLVDMVSSSISALSTTQFGIINCLQATAESACQGRRYSGEKVYFHVHTILCRILNSFCLLTPGFNVLHFARTNIL